MVYAPATGFVMVLTVYESACDEVALQVAGDAFFSVKLTLAPETLDALRAQPSVENSALNVTVGEAPMVNDAGKIASTDEPAASDEVGVKFIVQVVALTWAT